MQTPQSAPAPLRQRVSGSHIWRTVRAATWLEWQSRGNWTNPVLYSLFIFLKPLTAALVLVFMYRVVSGPNAHGGIYSYLIVGSAAWTFVDQVMSGLPQAVLADREEYAMLKYVYIAPQQFLAFLVGRAVPRSLVSLISFVVTITFGIVFLGVPINPLAVNYPLLLVALVVGFVSIVAFGIILAGTALMLKRGAYQMPEAVTGALYLVSGAIFPILVLPGWLQKVAMAFPLTYWLELIRRAVLGNAVGAVFPVSSTPMVFLLLVVTTTTFASVSFVIWRISDFQARERGQIDRTTGW